MYKHEGSKVDWTKQYAIVGEYVVQFEQIVERIRFGLSAIFQIRGLADWRLSEIAFGQKQFTADPLITCYQSICNELLKNISDSEDILENVKGFKNNFSKQIQFRNDLLHSYYPIGSNTITISDNPNPPGLKVIKTSPTSKGARKKEVANSIEDVKKHIIQLEKLNSEFMKVDSSITIFLFNNKMDIGFKSIKGKD